MNLKFNKAVKAFVIVLLFFVATNVNAQITGPTNVNVGDEATYTYSGTVGDNEWQANGGIIVSESAESVTIVWIRAGQGSVRFEEYDTNPGSKSNLLYVTVSTVGWQSDGANKIYAVGESIGIGTDNPTDKLVVSGGRVELTAGTDAGKSQGSGVLEIANSLRLDGNEIITNEATSLYLQNDNNGDLIVDNGTFKVDASSNTVGIGVVNPSFRLHVAGDIYANGGWYRFSGATGLYSQSYGAYFYAADVNYWRIRNDHGLQFYKRDGSKRLGTIYHDNNNSFGLLDGDGNWSIRCEKDVDTRFYVNNSEKMRIATNGNVAIGSTNTSEDFKLSVKGKVRADEVTVYTDWADYVFAPDYNLKPIEEVNSFIKENNHLPDVPSEKEVLENGVEVGEMNKILLQKIEELTLYVIELNEKNKQLEDRINQMEEE